MKGITKRQKLIYDFICKSTENNDRPPTITEIKDNFEYASNQAVVDHLIALEKKGFIKRIAKSRGIIPLKVREGIPILGQIAAGNPTFAEELFEGTLKLEDEFEQKNTYVLRVKGDSMKDAGIFDKDFVIVKYVETVNNGDIGVALIEDEATVKRIYFKEDKIILQPENDEYKPIIIDDNTVNFRICGKVIGLVRNLHSMKH